nr:glycosyltransferase [Shouchella clausii]
MEQPVNHRFFEERNAKVIVTVGRLHVQKDYPTLLRAFANLQQNELPEARLLFIGDGEENEPLKKLAFELGVRSVVDFAGFQPNPYAYMKKAHLFALSSAWEGFGNVIVEALATGTPVVATDCPSGPREILADGKYGQLVPVGDTVALAQAMKDALLSHHDEAELISRAREFTVEACAAAYETLFR